MLRQSTRRSPHHFNLLSTVRLHTGADWRMQAGCRSTSLCQDSYLSQSCQRRDWQAVTGSAHLLLPLRFSLPRVEPTTRLRESRHDVCATVPRPRDISCGWYWHLLQLHVCRQSWPFKGVCGNGVNVMVAMQLVSTVTPPIVDWEINYMVKLKIGQLGCTIGLKVNLKGINFNINIYFSTFPLYVLFWNYYVKFPY